MIRYLKLHMLILFIIFLLFDVLINNEKVLHEICYLRTYKKRLLTN